MKHVNLLFLKALDCKHDLFILLYRWKWKLSLAWNFILGTSESLLLFRYSVKTFHNLLYAIKATIWVYFFFRNFRDISEIMSTLCKLGIFVCLICFPELVLECLRLSNLFVSHPRATVNRCCLKDTCKCFVIQLVVHKETFFLFSVENHIMDWSIK